MKISEMTLVSVRHKLVPHVLQRLDEVRFYTVVTWVGSLCL